MEEIDLLWGMFGPNVSFPDSCHLLENYNTEKAFEEIEFFGRVRTVQVRAGHVPGQSGPRRERWETGFCEPQEESWPLLSVGSDGAQKGTGYMAPPTSGPR